MAFAILLVAGCRSTQPLADRPDVPDAFPNHTLSQILTQLRPTGADTLRSFRAKASLSIKTPEQGGNLSADIRARRNDSLYMTVSPGLGIEAARILVTPDSFFVYDRIKKKLTYGAIANASRALPLPLSGDDAFLLLIGLSVPEPEVAWKLDVDEERYILSDPDGRRRYSIDPAVWRIANYEEWDAQGHLVESRMFSDYDLFGNLFLPRRIELRRPQDNTRATIYYRELSFNPSSIRFPFSVSSSADRELIGGESASGE